MSVRRSVGPSVGHTRVKFLLFRLKWNKIALRTWCYATFMTKRLKFNKRASTTWNYHLIDHLKTSTRADRQKAFYVCTPSDLFSYWKNCFIRLKTAKGIENHRRDRREQGGNGRQGNGHGAARSAHESKPTQSVFLQSRPNGRQRHARYHKISRVLHQDFSADIKLLSI